MTNLIQDMALEDKFNREGMLKSCLKEFGLTEKEMVLLEVFLCMVLLKENKNMENGMALLRQVILMDQVSMKFGVMGSINVILIELIFMF